MAVTPSGFLIVRLDQGLVQQMAEGARTSQTGRFPASLVEAAEQLGKPELRDLLNRYLPTEASFPSLRDQPISHHLNLEEKQRRETAKPGRSLASYFVVDARSLDMGRRHTLLRELQGLQGIVERAYSEPELSLPVVPGSRRSAARSGVQGHLLAAPEGIGVTAPALKERKGGEVGFVDVEAGWNLQHEDLPQARPYESTVRQPLHGRNSPEWRDHGTEVLGVILSQGNATGILGIAPAARFVGVASYETMSDPWDYLGAILASVRALKPGDVLLIEAQVSGVGTPIEVYDHFFDAIRFAVSSGLVVIEAAGNGGVDLDDDKEALRTADGEGTPTGRSLKRGSPQFMDSGAILVSECAAKSHGSTGAHRILEEATFGSRVDCFAWGEEVRTLGRSAFDSKRPKGVDPNRDYTATFGGTSAASAIVAGAAILIQEMAERTRQARLGPGQVRLLLSDPELGTPVEDKEGRRVGSMPNLELIAARIPQLPDLYIRDFEGDTGAVQGERFQSPDIIVRSSRSDDPEGDFGDAGKVVPMPPLKAGEEYYVYVRISRRLGTPKGARLKVYAGEGDSTARFHELKEIPVDLSQDRSLTVAGPIPWRPSTEQVALRASGFLVAVLDHAEDPGPEVLILLDQNQAGMTRNRQTQQFVRGSNNVAWRRLGL